MSSQADRGSHRDNNEVIRFERAQVLLRDSAFFRELDATIPTLWDRRAEMGFPPPKKTNAIRDCVIGTFRCEPPKLPPKTPPDEMRLRTLRYDNEKATKAASGRLQANPWFAISGAIMTIPIQSHTPYCRTPYL